MLLNLQQMGKKVILKTDLLIWKGGKGAPICNKMPYYNV